MTPDLMLLELFISVVFGLIVGLLLGWWIVRR